MPYRVEWSPRALRDLDRLDLAVRRRILRRAIGLETNPRSRGCIKLGGEDIYRVRIGDYRVLCRIDDHNRIVLVVRVAHRREVYRRP